MNFRWVAPSFLVFILFLSGLEFSRSAVTPEFSDFPFSKIADEVDMNAIGSHIRYFEDCGSRMTGYTGAEAAALYISQRFLEHGLTNVRFHEFNVTVPLDEGASLTLISPNISLPVYPMAPNLVAPVTTLPTGLTGPIVFAGDGHMSDFNGKKVEGSIVLMNFNTQFNWLNAAKLGAKAVLFIEPEDTTQFEVGAKKLEVPFNFPRFFIKRSDESKILMLSAQGANMTARLASKMSWKVKNGKNVLGLVEGSTYKNQIIMVSAYYDLNSIVPSLAPGAEEATGISVLLELARFFKAHQPKYSVMFVAFSGHHQGLSGSRWFVEDFFFGKDTELGKKIILQINLDLSTGSDTLAVTNTGDFYHGYTWLNGAAYKPFGDYLIDLADRLSGKLVNGVYASMAGGSPGSYLAELQKYYPLGVYWMSDCEPLTANKGPGFSLKTIYDTMRRMNSPLDTCERLNLDNLRVQAETVFGCLYAVVTTINLRETYLSSFSYSQTANRVIPAGWYLKGKVATYNQTIGWYTEIPEALVAVKSPGLNSWVMTTDENGGFIIPQMQSDMRYVPVMIHCFRVNETTGNLIYAPDHGSHAYASSVNTMEADRDIGFFVVSKCASVVLFDLFDPYFLQIPKVDGGQVELNINLRATHSPPESFGTMTTLDATRGFSVAVLNSPPDVPVEITLAAEYTLKDPLSVLINASGSNPEGTGYIFRAGQQYVFVNTPLQFAENMYWANEDRISTLKIYGLEPTSVDLHSNIGRLIEKSCEMLSDSRYDRLHDYSMTAWSLGRKVYLDVKTAIEEPINTIMFFAGLLVPFVILAERLLLHGEGFKRLIGLVGIFACMNAILSLAHPGFRLASNIIMMIVGFMVIVLITPVLGVTFRNFMDLINRVARKVVGLHFAKESKGSAMVLAFATGLENVRKRKLRSSLTITSVALIVLALVMFSSMYSITILRPAYVGGEPSYQGMMFKRDWGGEGLSHGLGQSILEEIQAVTEGKAVDVRPRAWLYTVAPGDPSTLIEVTHGDVSLKLYAMLGLAHEEEFPTDGRWFLPTDNWACILTEDQARRLEIKELPSTISVYDMDFTVVGLISGDYMNRFIELDGEGITPLDRSVEGIIHTGSDHILLLQYRNALSLGAQMLSVSVEFEDPELISEVAGSFFHAFPGVYVYVGLGDTTSLYSKATSFITIGWEMQVIPLVLSAILILNLMLGSVHERTREIFTYSSVGLSPVHVAFMFLAESAIYGMVGGLIGYMTAMLVCKIVFLLYPGAIAVNYAASWVVTAVTTAMSVTIISTAYPLRTASRMVTPSLERAWRVPTSPTEKEWEIPLPFTITSGEEAWGVMTFLAEYIGGHTGDVAVFSVRRPPSYREGVENRERFKTLEADIRLPPYDIGIRQNAQIRLRWNPAAGRWGTTIHLTRTFGDRERWISSNYVFLSDLRKQMLIWRSLEPQERSSYIKRRTELDKIRRM